MSKTLQQLLSAITTKSIVGNPQVEITSITCDSREASQGALFIAVKGVAVDAHRFIPDVVKRGAAAIVCEDLPADMPDSVTFVQVEDSHVALAVIASEWFDRPSEKLKLVGVTGTNGKTTTATLLYELTRMMGYKAGLLSTVQNIIDRKVIPAKQTTPDHIALNSMLHDMVLAGCDYAFMEVSSHACAQHRIDGLTFKGGIFSNLTRDHLDYHKTVENYIEAKKMFFDALPSTAFALVNIDDKVGQVMVQNTKASKHTYSLRSIADFKGKMLEERIDGTLLEINGKQLEVLFTGRFNAYNLLAVYGAATLLGFPEDELLVKMTMLKPVAGRFQTMRSPRGYTAIVDYAHTPDALVNVLNAIGDVINGKAQIITVCGCGGDRDKGKRPIMAHEAVTRSDKVILTSDNPRTEDPDAILRDMQAGVDPELSGKVLTITDRRQGIATACMLAQPGDVVLVAGKGHEDYQEINGVKHHFDDREVLEDIFKTEKL
jgi:UDP-N-acetylmuramoyl-L-alanyl-D-glutamate--2,6-diaminopimelate ligase